MRYTNKSGVPTRVRGWTNHAYLIAAKEGAGEPAFWSYQSGSYKNRPDWVLPLKVGFKQDNFLGMNSTDYGGGTPVSDVWRRDVGIAIGHLERVPKLVSLPITMPDAAHATVALSFQSETTLKPGESLDTFPTFVAVHQGDYFQSLQGLQRGDAASRREIRSGARERIRRDLVRLGLREDFHSGAGGERACRW